MEASEKWKHPLQGHIELVAKVKTESRIPFSLAGSLKFPTASETVNSEGAMVLVKLLSECKSISSERNWEGFHVKTSLTAVFFAALESALLRSCAVYICLCEALCMLSHDSLFYHYYGDVPFPSTFNHLVFGHILSPQKISINQGNAADSHLAD